MSPEEALANFLKKGEAKEVDTPNAFNPSMRLQNDEAQQLYVQGVLLKRKEAKSSYGDDKKIAIYVIKVSATNAPASVQVKKGEYKDVMVQAGTDVDLWTATNLDRQLNTVPFGSEVFIKYLGKAKKAEKGKNKAHLFQVVTIPVTAPAVIENTPIDMDDEENDD